MCLYRGISTISKTFDWCKHMLLHMRVDMFCRRTECVWFTTYQLWGRYTPKKYCSDGVWKAGGQMWNERTRRREHERCRLNKYRSPGSDLRDGSDQLMKKLGISLFKFLPPCPRTATFIWVFISDKSESDPEFPPEMKIRLEPRLSCCSVQRSQSLVSSRIKAHGTYPVTHSWLHIPHFTHIVLIVSMIYDSWNRNKCPPYTPNAQLHQDSGFPIPFSIL